MTSLNGACLSYFEMLLQQRNFRDWGANHLILTITVMALVLGTKCHLRIKLTKLHLIACHMCFSTSKRQFVGLFSNMSVLPLVRPYVCMSTCVSVILSVNICIYIFIYIYIYVCVCGNRHMTKIYIWIYVLIISFGLISSMILWTANAFAMWIYIYIYNISIYLSLYHFNDTACHFQLTTTLHL